MLADAIDSMVLLSAVLVALVQLVPATLAYSRKNYYLALALLAVVAVANGFLLTMALVMFRQPGGTGAAGLLAGMAGVVWVLCLVWAFSKKPLEAH